MLVKHHFNHSNRLGQEMQVRQIHASYQKVAAQKKVKPKCPASSLARYWPSKLHLNKTSEESPWYANRFIFFSVVATATLWYAVCVCMWMPGVHTHGVAVCFMIYQEMPITPSAIWSTHLSVVACVTKPDFFVTSYWDPPIGSLLGCFKACPPATENEKLWCRLCIVGLKIQVITQNLNVQTPFV